ncbi:hypothetical protein EYC84_011236 [Monilinia fructicola]|uniref:2EXR domain-containing protein n=1 Tax=Monilinia fructicola TaxID=38448 RepID=A0A5M9J8W9_MONFR|nr:hypothetical protein EYC84_011236 [Monilinia fructicola]
MLKSIFLRPGFTKAGRRKLYNRLVQKNWENYLRHLQSIKSEKLEKIVPITHFADLPPEIRDVVWELSLPGPRILYLDGISRPIYDKNTQSSSDSFQFLKYHNPPNPSALLICRASRDVALKRYRIIPDPGFGIIYADFAGGDILYIDEHNVASFSNVRWESDAILMSSVLDLSMLERVIVAKSSFADNWRGRGILDFLQGLPKLKEILLDVSQELAGGAQWSHGPGTVQMNELGELNEISQHYLTTMAQKGELLWEWTRYDEAKGFPKLTPVSTSIVANLPKDNWLVDMAEHDEPLSLILKKLQENGPTKKRQKGQSTTEPTSEPVEISEFDNAEKSVDDAKSTML